MTNTGILLVLLDRCALLEECFMKIFRVSLHLLRTEMYSEMNYGRLTVTFCHTEKRANFHSLSSLEVNYNTIYFIYTILIVQLKPVVIEGERLRQLCDVD